MTAQPTLRSGSDVFFALSEWRSRDGGKTWDGPLDHPDTLGRRDGADGLSTGVCDMEPEWHAASGKLLSIGHTVGYRDDREPVTERRRSVAYSVYDPIARMWSAWDAMALPEVPEFANAGAGCVQRVDLEDGTILLPFSFKEVSANWNACHLVSVARCTFDGARLAYAGHGQILSLGEPRGFCEPSLIRYHGRYYLTLRNDTRGYVTAGDDGLHFETPRPWCFDDGTELGNYNTQQHWISNRHGLFLVYTRRGLNNDHVFRHRAPLMIAEVDPDRLTVRRHTERELVLNRGARLGNFSVCHVSPDEAWVTVAEWMQPDGCERYGSDNTVWIARVTWPVAG